MQCERDLVAHGGTDSSMKNEFPLGMRVLAVDDDRACLRMLETLLGQCGYRGCLFFFRRGFVVIAFFWLSAFSFAPYLGLTPGGSWVSFSEKKKL